ncbi:MAG: LemA family protein [Brumimicrobium sp.]
MSTGILIGLLILVLYCIYVYNSFVRTENLVKNAFHNIDVMLKKRYDLIPQLVNSVKGIMKHEKETLVDVEDNLSASRRSYNANVARYNTLLKSFPSNIIGNKFSYKEKTGFQATSAERMRPETTM